MSDEVIVDGDAEMANQSIFSTYACRSIPYGQPHPGDIAEATSLSSVQLPPSSYPLLDSFPEDLVTKGVLSKLQLEGVLYAATKHQQILPDGQRAGFFIGDGAGVGKGRQIAAVILDNYVRGRRKAAWLSISTDLCMDAKRDLKDLGSHINVINNVQTLDKETKALGLSSDFQTGVLFLTYSSLISSVNGKTRLQQIIDWLGGPAFDGCLVFDECHKAKNFVPGKEGASTKMATAVLELQNRLPMARVLYCSATGVSEVGHMAYMTRMGLWGVGTAFKDFDTFLDAMKRRGVSFLEMLAMELKSEGKYVARGLSFRDAEFSEMEARLTPQQVQLYNSAVSVWVALRDALNSALALTGSPGAAVWKLYWSAQQRFFKLLCVSLKVPTVVRESKKALESNCAVVIGLQTTGEAADASVGIEQGAVPGFVSTTKEMLVRFIRDHFPVTRHASDKDKSGQQSVRPPGPPQQVKECVEVRGELLTRVQQLDLPPNFLDQIIDELGGVSQVAEMTGRKGRIVRTYVQGRPTNSFAYELRAKPDSADMDSLNIHEKELFNSGQRLVAIISDAASTGISLHASRSVANQRRRVHLTIELPWSADKAIQQLGRSHRSNQVTGPVYKLISTTIGGEKRFAAAVARRLQSLGALTRGDRRAASGIDLSEQNFDSPLGRRSLRRMYDALVTQSPCLPPGVSLASVLRDRVKEELGKPDMPDHEAEAVADIQDPEMRTRTILSLHQQLREYVDVMGVGVQSGRGDTVAENLDLAMAGQGLNASSAAAVSGNDKGGGAAGKDVGDVRRFLNRLLGLPVEAQALLFAYFQAVLTAEVEAAKKEGKYSEGVSDLSSSRIKVSGPPSVIWEDPLSGLKTFRNDFTVDRGMSYEEACAKLRHELGGSLESGTDDDVCGFRRSARQLYGGHLVLLAIRKPAQRSLFTVYRPNTGQSALDMERSELEQRYIKISAAQAKHEWQAAHESSLSRCMHGKDCKQGSSCNVGRRLASVTVLSGSVVRVWGVLESVLARHEAELSRAERIMRVVRVEMPLIDKSGSTTNASAAPAAVADSDSDLEIIEDTSQPPQPPPQAAGETAGTRGVSEANGSNDAEQGVVSPRSNARAINGQGSPSKDKKTGKAILPSDHIVGVRYPSFLLPEVVAVLQSAFIQSVASATGNVTDVILASMAATAAVKGTLQGNAAAASAVARINIESEPPTPVDTKWKTKAFTAPKSIGDYFKKGGWGAAGPRSATPEDLGATPATQRVPPAAPTPATQKAAGAAVNTRGDVVGRDDDDVVCVEVCEPGARHGNNHRGRHDVSSEEQKGNVRSSRPSTGGEQEKVSTSTTPRTQSTQQQQRGTQGGTNAAAGLKLSGPSSIRGAAKKAVNNAAVIATGKANITSFFSKSNKPGQSTQQGTTEPGTKGAGGGTGAGAKVEKQQRGDAGQGLKRRLSSSTPPPSASGPVGGHHQVTRTSAHTPGAVRRGDTVDQVILLDSDDDVDPGKRHDLGKCKKGPQALQPDVDITTGADKYIDKSTVLDPQHTKGTASPARSDGNEEDIVYDGDDIDMDDIGDGGKHQAQQHDTHASIPESPMPSDKQTARHDKDDDSVQNVDAEATVKAHVMGDGPVHKRSRIQNHEDRTREPSLEHCTRHQASSKNVVGGAAVGDTGVDQLMCMGFTRSQAVHALQTSHGNVQQAVEMCLNGMP